MVSERKQNRKRVGNRDDKNHKQGTKVSQELKPDTMVNGKRGIKIQKET